MNRKEAAELLPILRHLAKERLLSKDVQNLG